jgi:hypothetical protein
MESNFELFFKRALVILSTMGVDAENVLANQYELILEADLKTVEDRVVFQAIGSRGSREFITEVKLMPQDIFVCNEWGLFLLNTDGERDVKFEEHTFPDRQYFDTRTAVEAEIFYNADLSLVVNNFIAVRGVRTDKFKVYKGVHSRRNCGMSGLIDIEDGYLWLDGSKNVYFDLDLPRKIDLKDSTLRLRLRLGGILFHNASIIT